MNYDDAAHQFLANTVMQTAEQWFQEGLQRGFTDVPRWARELGTAFAEELEIVSASIKHPKFSGEREWRIAARLRPEDRKMLEFRQKRTLLARHLPLSLKIDSEGKPRLP